MTRTACARLVALALVAGGDAAFARDTAEAQSSRLFDELLQCRQMTDSAARLQCYDGRAATIAAARARREVAVIDSESVRKTERDRFGLPEQPVVAPPAAPGGERADVREIQTKVTSASELARNRWRLAMADGSEWQTIEAVAYRVPKAGQEATIKKAALGTFVVVLKGWPAIRAKRIK